MGSKRGKKGQSINRQIKRGHVVGHVNVLTGFYEMYRRTRNNKNHTVFIGQFDLKD